jgi:hypothetical protein
MVNRLMYCLVVLVPFSYIMVHSSLFRHGFMMGASCNTYHDLVPTPRINTKLQYLFV